MAQSIPAFPQSTTRTHALLSGIVGFTLAVAACWLTELFDPPFNLMVHTSPNLDYERMRPGHFETLRWDYHWHIEIIPRLTKVAGFEWGSGFYINPMPPENAAGFLRDAGVPSPS